MKELTCPSCQVGTIRDQSAKGRRFPHHQFGALMLDDELPVPTCEACGEEWLDGPSTRALDEALERAARRKVRDLAEQAIERLRPYIKQRDLERLLDLSPGLISKVKNGKDTSGALTAVLMLLANQPHRVTELQQLWRDEAPRSNIVEIESLVLNASKGTQPHVFSASESPINPELLARHQGEQPPPFQVPWRAIA